MIKRFLMFIAQSICLVLLVYLIWIWAGQELWNLKVRHEAKPRIVTARGDLADDEQSTIALFEQARGSVVFISTRQRIRDIWSRNIYSIPSGTGSGFVWDEHGHIITNLHVIDGANEAQISLADGRFYRAALVGASRPHDLAVLRIGVGVKRPPPIPVGESANLRVGQKVFAIGNPFGLDWTLTSGIVSALNRSLPGDNDLKIDRLIQTDAAINPGNSGGPLLDSAGRLIGVNTAIYSPSGAYAGIGFAVPVDTVNKIVPQLIKHGRYIRPALGIEIDETINQQLIQGSPLEGVAVLRVLPDSTAQSSGLRGVQLAPNGDVILGDIITAINNDKITSVPELFARLEDHNIGDLVTLSIQRHGQNIQVKVLLQAGNRL